ncbi:MAG: hypothetical protein HQL62_03935, partial [Magnetococcales bacterium]|nr:hypothetical protein [Magnetococcales bacterium]
MEIDLRGLSANQVYHHMNQTLVPRPIAWVLTENASGSLNLAPFSYFNGVTVPAATNLIDFLATNNL